MSDQKKYVMAMAIQDFDPYGQADLMDYYNDLPDDTESVIAELIEWYIGGELTEEDNPSFIDLIKKIRLTASLEF